MADETKKAEQDEQRTEAGAEAPAAEADGGPSETVDVPTLEARVADLTDRLLRAHADMDNLRKRTERDKEDMAKYAISKFAREVLSVGDNLQRAIAAVETAFALHGSGRTEGRPVPAGRWGDAPARRGG